MGLKGDLVSYAGIVSILAHKTHKKAASTPNSQSLKKPKKESLKNQTSSCVDHSIFLPGPKYIYRVPPLTGEKNPSVGKIWNEF